ncbi:MAG: CARDB domain-containing protein, partial [Blastocatellia bacterium]
MSASLFQKLTTKAIFLTTTSLALAAGGFATYFNKAVIRPVPQPKAQRVPFQSTNKSLPLREAQTLANAEFAGGSSLSLATADFDEDGTPDVIGGYTNGGVGFVRFYRGNVEAVYPSAKTATDTFAFFPASSAVNLSVPPDFLVAGDFNADGHSDVLAAARGSNLLSFLAGDGKGGFAEARNLILDGNVTALEAGEINRVDGLPDVAIGIETPSGAQLLLYSAATGAWQAQPQQYELAHAATSLAFAQLTGDAWADLAIAAGNELDILAGNPQTPTLTRQALDLPVASLAVGHFTNPEQEQIALLARNGSLAIATRSDDEDANARFTARRRNAARWQIESAANAKQLEVAATSQLLQARVSGQASDDLLLLEGNQLQFVTKQAAPAVATASLAQGMDLVAALPLRLSASAVQGLVLLSRDQSAPITVRAVPEATFVVNSTSDLGDALPGDGICSSARAGAAVCTLRAAIEEANATAAADTITFTIGTGQQTILLNTPLPDITNPVTIDGTSQPIVINPGPNYTGGVAAFTLSSNTNTIRGLTIANFTSSFAVYVLGTSNNVIEGNTLTGNIAGVVLSRAPNNLIGGTTAAARNVIGGHSSNGIIIDTNASMGNRVLGNYIGTDSTGTKGNGNGYGIAIFFAANNTIGGTTAGARNVIAANRLAGIRVFGGLGANAANGNTIQGNYIGVDATGTGALGNGLSAGSVPDSGILLTDTNNTTIGGTATGAGNVIANNGGSGVNLPTPSFTPGITAANNAIQGNSITANGSLGIDLGATGVTANDTGDPDIGANNQQNFPVLTTALTRTTGTTIAGTLNSTASTAFTIEVFSNATCDSSGNGEGETFVGRTNVTTNATGNASFTLTLTTPITAGRVVTATATDSAGNTSEFSACLLVQNAVADLGVTVAAAPATLNVGNNLTYDITVTNSGPDDATGVTLTDAISIPNGTFTFVSATPSAGTCTGTGPITCNLGTIAPNGNATVRVIITPTIPTTPPVSGVPPVSVTATNNASVTGIEQDRNTTNNGASASATVNAVTDLAVTQTVNPAPPTSNATATYTITITNNGPSAASFVSARIDPPVQLFNATCTAPAGWSCGRDGNPFFASTTSLSPGSAVITIRGTVPCFSQNTALTSAVTVSNQAADSNTANNTSSLTSTAQAGTAVGTVTYDAGGAALSLGPVVAGSTATPPSATFTLTNTGCLPMALSNAFFARVTNAANLSGVDDSRYFSLRLIPATGAEIPLPTTPNPDRNAAQPIAINRTLQSGEQLRFRVLFNPPLPAFAGTFAARDVGVFATQVLPD